MLQRPKSGYNRTFTTGVTVAASAVNGSSSTGMYAYTTTPVTVGQSGVRSFGGDASGVLCFKSDGSAIGLTNGALLLSSCTVLQ